MSSQLKALLTSGKTNSNRLKFCLFYGFLLFFSITCIFSNTFSSLFIFVSLILIGLVVSNLCKEYKERLQLTSTYIKVYLTLSDKQLLTEELRYNQPSLSINFIGLVVSGVSLITSLIFGFFSFELTLFLQDYSKAESQKKLFELQQILHDEITAPLQNSLAIILAVAFLFALVFSIVYSIRVFRFYKYKIILGLLYHDLY